MEEPSISTNPEATPASAFSCSTKSKLLCVSAGLVALVIVAIASFVLGRTSLPRDPEGILRGTPTTIIPTSIPTPDETGDWKTYTNTKYGYSIKYPSNLIIKEQESDLFLHQVYFQDTQQGYLKEVIIEVKKSTDLNSEKIYRTWRVVGHVADKIKKESSIKISNNEAIRLDYEVSEGVPPINQQFSLVFFNHGSYLYELESNTLLLDQILSTFKFLD